jgi:hypothetical protein
MRYGESAPGRPAFEALEGRLLLAASDPLVPDGSAEDAGAVVSSPDPVSDGLIPDGTPDGSAEDAGAVVASPDPASDGLIPDGTPDGSLDGAGEQISPLTPIYDTILSDGFDNGTFATYWTVGNLGGITSSKWGDNTARHNDGNRSAFCADNASDTRTQYDSNLHTYMDYKTQISLANYSAATLSFCYLVYTETADYLSVLIKDSSGTWTQLWSLSGHVNNSNTKWKTKGLSLNAYAGQSNLTLRFRFDSSSGVPTDPPSGVWIDTVTIIAERAVTPPDLAGLSFATPSTAHWGDTVTVQGKVINNNNSASTGTFTQQFILSADTTWGNADDVVLGTYIHGSLGSYGQDASPFGASVTLPDLPPNASYTVTDTVYIGMKTDSTNAVAETNETNNGPGLGEGYDWDTIALTPIGDVKLLLYQVTDTSGTPNSNNPGAAKTTFFPGETVRITLSASCLGASRAVRTGLVIYGPDNVTVVYDSHAAGQDNTADSPLDTLETDYYSFDWTLPADAKAGAYDLVGSIRSPDWGTIYDTTAPGWDNTAAPGLDARLRDQFWRFQDTPQNRTYEDTSEYLMGKVWVNVILPSSTGTSENWTTQEISTIKTKVTEGVTWWATTLPDANLEFGFDWTYLDNPVSTSYEPITLSSSQDYLWVGDMLNAVAPDTTGTTENRLRQFADETRRASGSDWAFTVFVVDDSNDSDHKFSDGTFAYVRDLGYPALVETYNNDGWGTSYMGQVTAHEMGHVFYACDEYLESYQSYYDYSGYFNTQNLNAAYERPADAPARVDSLMAEDPLQSRAYTNHTSSLSSLQMVGYKDTDADHIPDILDTLPTITTATLSSDPVAGTIRIRASGAIVPLGNLNPNSPHPPARAISLNTISTVQYRVDDGLWQDLPAEDGIYDEHAETAVLDLAGLAGGDHHIYFRSRSSIGRWSQDGNFSAAPVDVSFHVNQAPVVASFMASPSPVVRPGQVTLTASVSDPDAGGSVAGVAFYRETNGTPGLQTGAGGDFSLGPGASGPGGWTLAVSTAGLAAATYTYYVQATDNLGAKTAEGVSAPSAAGTVQDPPTAVWLGVADTAWENPANWDWNDGFVPGPQTVVVFNDLAPYQPKLSQDQAVKGIDIRTAGWTLNVNGYTLTVGTEGISIPGGGAATSKLDLGAGFFILDYDGLSGPTTQIKQWIVAGRNGGAWTGNGITSSAAAATPSLYAVGYIDNALLPPAQRLTLFGGVAVDATSILIRYTWACDLNLDGLVTDADVTVQSALYDNGLTTGHYWWDGDLNFDERIGDADVTVLSALYPRGQVNTGEQSVQGAPEPAAPITGAPEPAAPITGAPESAAPILAAPEPYVSVVQLVLRSGGWSPAGAGQGETGLEASADDAAPTSATRRLVPLRWRAAPLALRRVMRQNV